MSSNITNYDEMSQLFAIAPFTNFSYNILITIYFFNNIGQWYKIVCRHVTNMKV